jgi:transcriptional regulator with XRE-family HTH domain
MITAAQIRAARALLHLDQSDLARRAGVSLATLRRVEAGNEPVLARSAGAIRQALESAGAQFILDGVRCPRTRSPEEVEARYRKIIEISERSAKLIAESPGGFSEDDLYDENGLPA